MSKELLTLIVINYAWIGYLPVGFFRRDGKLNLAWWLTGGPFFLVPVVCLLGFFHLLPVPLAPLAIGGKLGLLTSLLAVVLASSSIALIALTLGTHRVRLALWHQTNDAPASIVTYGAYRYIRHPFYTSFLMAFTAALLAAPGPLTAILLAYQFGALHVTAKREEGRLSESEFGEEYRKYLGVTGRFFPRLGGARP